MKENVKDNGLILHYASDSLKNNAELVKIAV
jgi:hypothetical protein